MAATPICGPSSPGSSRFPPGRDAGLRGPPSTRPRCRTQPAQRWQGVWASRPRCGEAKASGCAQKSPRAHASYDCRTISTFSCDIACGVSPSEEGLRWPGRSAPPPNQGLPIHLAHLHAMCVHWRGSPLPLALFPPPSITPRTASMPRSAFRSRAVTRSASWSGSGRRSHRLQRRWRRCASGGCGDPSPDQEPSLAAVPDDVAADKVVAAADRRLVSAEANPGPVRADDDVAGDQVAVSLLEPRCPPRLREMRFRAITLRLPEPTRIPEPRFRTIWLPLTRLRSALNSAGPLQEDSGPVAREHVSLDQVVGGAGDVDAGPGVMPE